MVAAVEQRHRTGAARGTGGIKAGKPPPTIHHVGRAPCLSSRTLPPRLWRPGTGARFVAFRPYASTSLYIDGERGRGPRRHIHLGHLEHLEQPRTVTTRSRRRSGSSSGAEPCSAHLLLGWFTLATSRRRDMGLHPETSPRPARSRHVLFSWAARPACTPGRDARPAHVAGRIRDLLPFKRQNRYARRLTSGGFGENLMGTALHGDAAFEELPLVGRHPRLHFLFAVAPPVVRQEIPPPPAGSARSS